jgi:hypothetical protein
VTILFEIQMSVANLEQPLFVARDFHEGLFCKRLSATSVGALEKAWLSQNRIDGDPEISLSNMKGASFMGLDIPGFTNYLAGLVPSFQGARLREKERGRCKEHIGPRQKRRLGLRKHLGDFESTLGKVFPDDLAVLYNADANQDWLHSLVSLRACIVLLQERFPNIKTLRLRTDGAGNFRNSSFVLLMPRLSQWTGLNILEFSVSEAGGGKDLTDSLIMQQKQRIQEGVKQTGGSARNPTECVVTVQEGEEQVGSRGSCATREMIYNRPSGGVIGAKKGALPGISTMYHYQYEFAEADVFVGIRVFFHEGIGCGKFYTANDCDSMLLKHEGLNEATVGELRMATSTLQEGDVARERASGQGARLLRGEEHKDFDADVRLQKQVKKNDVTAQKQEAAKDTAATAVAESGVMLCQYCSQPFVRQKCFRAHEDRCVEQSASRAAKRKTAVLRPAVDLAQDQVHSAASLSIGQGNLFRGQENKEMFFPTTIKLFPTPRDVSVVKEG